MKNQTKKNLLTAAVKGGAPEIIAETEDYLVINKPAGLAVHGGGNLKEATLADWLIARYPKIRAVGDDPARPGIVHRLDKEVSGLMVVVKNQKSFLGLKKQFQDRTIIKEYTALAHGQISKEDGEINFPIKRSSEGYKMAALPLGADNLLTRHQPKNRDQGNIEGVFAARDALTEFQVIKRFINYTLVRVKIKTGRTHQIRVHFFAYGHPLAGDDLYFTKKSRAINKKLNLGRIFLFADHLSFLNLRGEKQDFRLDFPPELKAALPKN
jgi:23S rRNA pseudouridine1911/1915/1917 synthase